MNRKYLILILLRFLYADCSDLNQSECVYYSDYCEWNDDTNQCGDIGGGGGNTDYGPYAFDFITQSDGMQDSPLYADATLYYPTNAEPPFSSIVLGPGWAGDQNSMADWAYFFASYGMVAVTIQYNDPENDSHEYRSEAMLDLIESIKQEQTRIGSSVYGNLDTTSFAAAGYSLSGGVVQLSAVLDSTLDAVIALNPTIIVEDCELCQGSNYCICLVPEFLDHSIPTLIISGENEINELPGYEGLLGSDQYENTPETTEKMLFEISSGGHGSAAFANSANGQVGEIALNWLKYYLLGDQTYCDTLMQEPEGASQFLTTMSCDMAPGLECIADDGTDGIELWGNCYSIENTTELDLSYIGITGGIPSEIGNLINLSSLILKENQINGEIPPEISYLTDLTQLDLGGNQFTGEIPPEIGSLTNLNILDLAGNQLTGALPAEIGNLGNLTELELGGNQVLGEIPPEIGNLENLTFIHLEYNQFTGEIPVEIGNLMNLVWLNFAHNQLEGEIPSSICNLNMNWSDPNNFNISENQFCPPYPDCIEDYVGDQDITNCVQVSIMDETFPLIDKLPSAYPNPFNPITSLRYDLPEDGLVNITIYDMMGRIVKTLVNESQTAGYKSIQWNATNDRNKPVSAGLYLYTIQAENLIQTKKMVYLK